MDLSPGGVRLLLTQDHGLRAGELRPVTLRFGVFSATIPARVAWVRPAAWRRPAEAGFEFVELTDEDRAVLERVARCGSLDHDWSRLVTAGSRGMAADSDLAPSDDSIDDGSTADLGGASVGLPDLYAMLGMDPSAGCDDAHAVYTRAIEMLRESGSGQAEIAERHAVLTKAYAVLSDPEMREEYDARLTGAYQAPHEADQASAKSSDAA